MIVNIADTLVRDGDGMFPGHLKIIICYENP
jgi:hypothetical protein